MVVLEDILVRMRHSLEDACHFLESPNGGLTAGGISVTVQELPLSKCLLWYCVRSLLALQASFMGIQRELPAIAKGSRAIA